MRNDLVSAFRREVEEVLQAGDRERAVSLYRAHMQQLQRLAARFNLRLQQPTRAPRKRILPHERR